MAKERTRAQDANRTNVTFRNFKVHSDSMDHFFVDSEPSNRVKAGSDGTQNKADISFKQLVEGNVMPNRGNGGVKGQTNRRTK